jgi:hypothetical protein
MLCTLLCDTESNFFELYLCKCEYVRCSSVVKCVRRAAPEDGPLGSKHVVPHMLINNCCIDGRIGIYIDCIQETGCKL